MAQTETRIPRRRTAATRTKRTPTLTTPTQTPTTPTPARSPALERCLEPVGPEEFFEEHWERKPLVVARDEAGRFDDLLSTGDVERLVCSGGLRFPAFRLVKQGAQIGLRDYTTDISWRPASFTGTADADRVAAAFAEGATIVLQALHYNWPPLARFCRELERELGQPVQVNSYYTPGRSQGFAVHHDTHEVIVLQVAGEKRWLVYEPLLELPLKHQRWSPKLGKPGAAVMDFTLRSGDTLYLPRGWPHEALTSDADSLHLTIGVNTHTWIDALKAALEACEDDVEFRRTVPADGETQADLLDRLAERLTPELVAARRRRRLVDTRRPLLDGQLSELRGIASVDAGTLLERRATVIADLDGTTLRFEGKHVGFPEQARAELEAMLAAEGPFRAVELPGELDEEGRLVLVRRLIREGFLRRRAAGA
jgi:ribosomal protein L16 Arg81 hydroxylase